ncbi:hypothetical protein BIW11_10878 [Tropilaelaps mercedesae]|uniref:C3H1-type domain-containing protein n=1 Tax=Tropilaelaps mercedesae TaxID=418985 RepID=A0A1V9XE11_9ACAR|nr:hypothetical protein BIW11_10878 [Tropilaelaps mercedesae]
MSRVAGFKLCYDALAGFEALIVLAIYCRDQLLLGRRWLRRNLPRCRLPATGSLCVSTDSIWLAWPRSSIEVGLGRQQHQQKPSWSVDIGVDSGASLPYVAVDRVVAARLYRQFGAALHHGRRGEPSFAPLLSGSGINTYSGIGTTSVETPLVGSRLCSLALAAASYATRATNCSDNSEQSEQPMLLRLLLFSFSSASVFICILIGSEEGLCDCFLLSPRSSFFALVFQDFLLSVISENPASERSCSVPSTEALSQLFTVRSELERDARVVVRFSDSEVLARGPQLNVQRAMQLVEEFLSATGGSQLLSGAMIRGGLKQSITSDSLLSETTGPGLRTTGSGGSRRDGRVTRRVESEDSSYDSDTESGLGPGTRSQGSQGGMHGAPGTGIATTANSAQLHKHDDVSRTVSDTLGAEFAEYVSTQKVELKAVLADPGYQTRLEFALKLGYTEAQVQTALQRLGLNAANNELLAELIKLSSSATKDDQTPVTPTASGDLTVTDTTSGGELRPIVIDGSNVAMSHGNKDVFSCRGIRLCVDWFRSRGHTEVTVFVPSWRKESARPNTPITDQEVLLQLEREKALVFTPSRNVGGKRLVCYEDRYVLKLAAETDGIVVSNDNYRDLVLENADFKKVVEERLLMYSFVNDRFMPPDDPLGRQGPTLDQFLRKPSAVAQQTVPPICPYAKKCTYGNKCKYYHPERGNMPQKSITERLAEQCKIQMQEVKNRGHHFGGNNGLTRTRSVPVTSAGDLSLPAAGGAKKKQPLSRTRSAAPSQRPQVHDDFSPPGVGSGSGNVGGPRNRPQDDVAGWSGFLSGDNSMPLWRPSSWSNLPPPNKTSLLSESGHLSLAKKLSDPAESHHDANVSPLGSTGLGAPGTTVLSTGSINNSHKKLHRQLTLNPTFDDRLAQMRMANGPNVQRSPTGQASGGGGGPQGPTTASHHNVARLSSDGPGPAFRRQTDSSCSGTMGVFGDGGWQTGLLSGQNSTSDTRLNMFPNQFVTPTCYQPSIWSSPLTPAQQGVHGVRPSSVPPQNRMRAPPLMVPPGPSLQTTTPFGSAASGGSGGGLGSGPLSTLGGFEERNKLYYRLASIFPEEQVKAAMDMHPEERNPQKMCATIVAMFPPKP